MCITRNEKMSFFSCFGITKSSLRMQPCDEKIVTNIDVIDAIDAIDAIDVINVIDDRAEHISIPERDTGFSRMSYLAQMASDEKTSDQVSRTSHEVVKRDRPSFDMYSALGCRVRPSFEATKKSLDWGVDRFYTKQDSVPPH